MTEVEQKYVIEVQGENIGKFNYYTECVSDKNIRIENKKLKRFVERSSSALYGEVKKLLRERFTLYFHVQKHKKEIVFLRFKIILSIQKEVQLLFGSNLISKRI